MRVNDESPQNGECSVSHTEEALDSQAAVRRSNLRRALQLVFRHPGEETRAGIARATGLTAATASSLVAELIDARLVVECGQARSTGGKRATTLSIDATHHLLLALVLRPVDAVAALVSLDGSTVYEERIAYSATTRERAVRDMLTRIAGRFGDRMLHASVQVTGATDGRVVLESVQLDMTNVPLAELCEEILGVRVSIINDVDAEAIAEVVAGEQHDGMRLFIHLGTGIGAAVTLDGDIAPGPHARSGEIGHVRVVFGPDAQLCRCGAYGCVEASASLTAILGIDYDESMDDDDVAPLLAAIEPETMRIGAKALARVIKLVGAMIDPAEVIIGGPAVFLGDDFLDTFIAAVREALSYDARGTNPITVRYARGDIPAFAGAAQFALTTALGVRWSPSQITRSATERA